MDTRFRSPRIRMLGYIVLFATLMALALVVSLRGFAPVSAAVERPMVDAGTAFDCDTAVDVPAGDCQALVDFYNSAGGNGWLKNAQWLSSTLVCEWEGISCTGNRVTAIVLNGNELNGSLPASIGNLNELQDLQLHENKLGGGFPASFAQLTKLKTLNLSSNTPGLTGAILDVLSTFPNLEFINLTFNSINQAIPTKLMELKNLTVLYLGHSGITGTIPTEIGKLGTLEKLSLSGNRMTGELPIQLWDLINLDTLLLHQTNWEGYGFQGAIPPEIGNLTKLHTLELHSNFFSGPIPDELGLLKALSKLAVFGNEFTGTLPHSLSQLPELKLLQAGTNKLSGPLTIPANGFPKLSGLYVDGNQFTGTIPSNLMELRSLTGLSLADNEFSGPVPAGLSALKSLKFLSLAGNNFEGPIPAELQLLTELEELYLNDNPSLTGTIPNEICVPPKLATLDLSNTGVSGVVPPCLFNREELTTLNLSGAELRGQLPFTLHTSLETLHLQENHFIGPVPETLATHSGLTDLNISSNALSGPISKEVACPEQITRLQIQRNKLHAANPEAAACLTTRYSDWQQFQTLPPTDLNAMAQSSTSLEISWTPPAIASVSSGYYEIGLSAEPGANSWITKTTDVLKDHDNYLFVNLTPGATYYARARINTPPLNEQKNELWSDYSVPTSVTLPGPQNTITVRDPQGNPVVGAELWLEPFGPNSIPRLTDVKGQATFSSLDVGDRIYARALVDQRERLGEDPPYRVYLTNMVVETDTVAPAPLSRPGSQEILLPEDSPLILFDLTVSVEWNSYGRNDKNQGLSYLSDLSNALETASRFLYDTTDGHFAFGEIKIYDGGHHWESADIQVLASNRARPSALIGGIVGIDGWLYKSTAGKESLFYSGFMRMGRTWNRSGSLTAPLSGADGFRTIVHEFAHYAFFLFDSYFYLDFNTGSALPSFCTSQDRSERPDHEEDATASIMAWHYSASEFWSAYGENPTNPDCMKSRQWQVHGESDWETIVNVYADTQNPARWRFRMPESAGYLKGPGEIPLGWTEISVVKPGKPHNLIDDLGHAGFKVRDEARSLLTTQAAQIYLVQMKDKQPERILDLGSANSSGEIELVGVGPDDWVLAVSWNGALFRNESYVDIYKRKYVLLKESSWQPALEAHPLINEENEQTGIALTVHDVPENSKLSAHLFAVGSSRSAPLTSQQSSEDRWTGTFHFEPGEPIREGHFFLTLEEGAQKMETLTTYAIGGSPGSHIRAYPPLDPASSDGNMQLHLPDGAVPTGTLAIVLPSWGLPAPAPTTVIPEPVGTVYYLGANQPLASFQTAGSLTLYWNEEMMKNITLVVENLRVFHYDEPNGVWSELPTERLESQFALSASIHKPGYYAIFALAPEIVELRTFERNDYTNVKPTAPVAESLNNCLNAVDTVFALNQPGRDGGLSKYVPSLASEAPYVNDLAIMEQNLEYAITMKNDCDLALKEGAEKIRSRPRGTVTDTERLAELPMGLFGTIDLEGEGLPPGKQITVRISETVVATATTQIYQDVTVYSLNIPADASESPAIEGGSGKAEMSIHYGSASATESKSWNPGATERFDVDLVKPIFFNHMPIVER